MTTNKTSKWDNRFLRVAVEVGGWSKDPSTKVGAVIVRDRRILATGYNGFPPGVADTEDRLHDRAAKLLFTVHAEENALLSCALHGVPTRGATLYVTRPPCAGCMRKIITAGVARVVHPHADAEFAARWEIDISAAEAMAREGGVEICEMRAPKWDAAATEACK